MVLPRNFHRTSEYPADTARMADFHDLAAVHAPSYCRDTDAVYAYPLS